MPDLNVVAVLVAKPGSADVVRDALKALVPPTLAEEGCLAYALYESDQAGTFITVEKWRSAADLETHMASAHIATTLEVAGEHLAAEPAIHSLTPVS